MKLTDVQRTILSSAAQRSDGAATPPERRIVKSAQKLAATLIEKGLVREVRAKADMPVWRRNEEGRACSLIVSKLGREAIKGVGDSQSADAGVETGAPSSTASEAPSQAATSSRPERSIPREGSKLAEVMSLLGRKQGKGIGVCRDFAHLALTLCRCLNVPARYINGPMGDIGVPVVDPMDFSAWIEVYLDGAWRTFDPRNNIPRIGRIVVARGRDAADIPLIISFGPHVLKSFRVWTYEVFNGAV
jgi:hypothetical protein